VENLVLLRGREILPSHADQPVNLDAGVREKQLPGRQANQQVGPELARHNQICESKYCQPPQKAEWAITPALSHLDRPVGRLREPLQKPVAMIVV
jgi:hypothetical protein